jgi:hypothetical protein
MLQVQGAAFQFAVGGCWKVQTKDGLSFLILSIYPLVLTCDWIAADFA